LASKHTNPAAVAFASILIPELWDQRFRSTTSWDHGDQNILIPQLWLSHHFDPRLVGIKNLAPQDHGIKSGLRWPSRLFCSPQWWPPPQIVGGVLIRVWPGLTGFGRVWPGLAGFGRVWPDWSSFLPEFNVFSCPNRVGDQKSTSPVAL
jgi:hypothetical protein